ncbi:MAG TPA: DUF4159 domain-containing protein [Pirellulaceae bacterium]|nr:DUF4159 domain-containing protein [Pirellulaceae bacterium]
MANRICSIVLLLFLVHLARADFAGAEITAAQVKESIDSGCKYLISQQHPDGFWPEYDGEPGGLTALCTMALLNSGRSKDDPVVAKALAYLERKSNPGRTYSASLMIMVFAQADPVGKKLAITRLANWLEAHQVRDNDTKGGWTYSERGGRADSSNTQFAILALHEAERVGVKVNDQTWKLALHFWTKPGMQNGDGGYGYDVGHPSTGSMTCAAIASLIIINGRLSPGDAQLVDGRLQCCGNQEESPPLDNALTWLSRHFSVQRNPNTPSWLLYYLYAMERVGRMSGQRTIGGHDWYREGSEFLVAQQDATLNNSWVGNGFIENNPIVATSFALLFLSKGRRPVVLGKLNHQPDALGLSSDWDHHRRAVQHLTMAVEQAWKRDLSWQTIDIRNSTAADLLEAPVLFLSGAESLRFTPDEKRSLKQYIEQGGFIFAEACDGNGCDGAQFDRDFRALMRELFPDTELRKLPPDHAVWYAEKPVDPKHLPQDPEFWLWGLDACCRTSVVYCPRSLSCYWELAHPYHSAAYAEEKKDEIEAVVNIGMNVVSYATGRELKEKLDRPQITISNPGSKSPRGALVVPKLSHGGGADDAPSALNNLLTVMEKQLEMRVDYEKRLIAPSDEKLYDFPVLFMHGRRSFKFSAAERKALKDYLDRGGFLFADSICANKEFADSLRAELKAIYPEADFARIPPSHAIFTAEFHGFDLPSVQLRDPQVRAEGDPLTAKIVTTTPLLEGLDIDGRIAVVLSPNDISCALEKGASLECKSYIPPDAARLGANVLLYALQQ